MTEKERGAHALPLYGLRNALTPSLPYANKVACCNSERHNARCSHSLCLSLNLCRSLSSNDLSALLCCYCNFVWSQEALWVFFRCSFLLRVSSRFLSSYMCTRTRTPIHSYLCMYILMCVCVHLYLFVHGTIKLFVGFGVRFIIFWFFHFLFMFGSCCCCWLPLSLYEKIWNHRRWSCFNATSLRASLSRSSLLTPSLCVSFELFCMKM